MDFQALAEKYKKELLENVIPFWLEKSQDKECGGFFTCLDRTGEVFDTDKFMWLQGREVWMFSFLYNKVEESEAVKKQWLDAAIQGAEWMRKYGHDGEYNWYFSTTRDGKPLVCPYNIFSYTFAAMAFGQLARATGNKEYEQIAKVTYEKILSKMDNPKGQWNKGLPGRPLKNFALPMIMCNLSLEIEHLLDKETMDKTIERCVHEVLDVFWRPEIGLVVENVTLDEKLSDSFDGRLLNPGHAIEAMWFIMDLGKRLGKPELIDKAVMIALKMVEKGWDEKYGGILYFMDRLGHPPQQLEWDQKLWWVHIETMICMSKGYLLTGNQECLKWFEKVQEYAWAHFKDQEYPEWYGYLNRQGEVLLPLKGGKWKGCFHVPRGMYQCWQIMKECAEKYGSK